VVGVDVWLHVEVFRSGRRFEMDTRRLVSRIEQVPMLEHLVQKTRTGSPHGNGSHVNRPADRLLQCRCEGSDVPDRVVTVLDQNGNVNVA
jgi:hypothetical protein